MFQVQLQIQKSSSIKQAKSLQITQKSETSLFSSLNTIHFQEKLGVTLRKNISSSITNSKIKFNKKVKRLCVALSTPSNSKNLGVALCEKSANNIASHQRFHLIRVPVSKSPRPQVSLSPRLPVSALLS